MISRYSMIVIFLLAGGEAIGKEVEGLSARLEKFYEIAVAVHHEEPEALEKDGRKYRVLLQDVETEKVGPKVQTIRGTGFFIFHDESYYFATARHIAMKLSPSCRLAFLNAKKESRQFVLAKLIGSKERFVWRHHERVDLSVLKLHLPETGSEEVRDLAMVTEDLYLSAPPRTSKLVVSGFPGGLGTRGKQVSQVTAVVHLASEEIRIGAKLEGVSIESGYLVSPPVGAGYSGAPVFYTQRNGEVKCVGILIGAWSDPTGGKFSISVAARHLLDLLDEDE